MKKKIIRVLGSCSLGDCKCLPLDGIEYDAVLMDIPPYHDGCTCLIWEEETEETLSETDPALWLKRLIRGSFPDE